MFSTDASSTAVRDALVAAVERGVEVSLLLDGFGSAARRRQILPAVQRQRRPILPVPPELRPPLSAPQPPETGRRRRSAAR